MRWRLLGAIPVTAADGNDVTLSAAGRHAGELLLAAPASALSPEVTWQPVAIDRVIAHIQLGQTTVHEVTLSVAPDGALTEVVFQRWGNPSNQGFGEQVFGAELHDEATFEGFTIPRTITAGWYYGTEKWDEGQFIRYTVDDARYR